MAECCYPKVSLDFIITSVRASGKLEDGGIFKVGNTTTFIQKGPKSY